MQKLLLLLELTAIKTSMSVLGPIGSYAGLTKWRVASNVACDPIKELEYQDVTG